MITNDVKMKIVACLAERRQTNFDSDKKMAVWLEISAAQLSRIMKGDIHQVIAEHKWISIARKLDLPIGNQVEWVTAKTPTFVMIWQQLTVCQDKSLSGIFADLADIGKTYTAKAYARANKFVAYIDCSQCKSKQKLIRTIAKTFGINSNGKYQDVYDDLVYYIKSIDKPLIILDEAGDLKYEAFLELKGLWNATERMCGYYMMGADALRVKIERNKEIFKVGYAELFSRYGNKYQRSSPSGSEALEEFKKKQVALIAKANHPTCDAQKMYAATDGSLRRIYTEIQKIKLQ